LTRGVSPVPGLAQAVKVRTRQIARRKERYFITEWSLLAKPIISNTTPNFSAA